MSPTADSASAAEARALVPENVLMDDEVVLLAIKPSCWFVLLTSWPVMGVAVLVAVAEYLAERALSIAPAGAGLYLLCLAAAVLQPVLASFQWLGRLYVLTDKRVLRIRGLFRVDVLQCPLRQMTQTALTVTKAERLLGLGTLFFEAEGLDACEAAWVNIARPEEVRAMVEEAIRRIRGRPGAPPPMFLTDRP